MRNRQFFCCPYYLKQFQCHSFANSKYRNKTQKFVGFSGTVMKIEDFYPSESVNAPAILISPPQYPAIVISKNKEYQNVVVDYFNKELINSDGNLKLNIAPSTEVILTNNQPFTGVPGNRNLIVIYGPTTKSIPAKTTPYKIIVLC